MSNQNLLDRLAQFQKEQMARFIAVEHKHQRNSITDDNVDWRKFDWRAIEEHFWQEVDELKGAFRHGSSQTQVKELVDVANLAFLLWWHESLFVKSRELRTP